MPTTISRTSRQRITTHKGVQLERAYVVLPSEAWAKLQAICTAEHRSGSQAIEFLINQASVSGVQKDKHESRPRNI